MAFNLEQEVRRPEARTSVTRRLHELKRVEIGRTVPNSKLLGMWLTRGTLAREVKTCSAQASGSRRE